MEPTTNTTVAPAPTTDPQTRAAAEPPAPTATSAGTALTGPPAAGAPDPSAGSRASDGPGPITGPPADAARATGPAPGPGFRLYRSRNDRMLGGVCGGLAESLGVDAALLRLGLVALTLLGAGIGVPLYIAAWILAPEA